MYGQSFSLADNQDTGLNAPTYGGGEAGDQTRARGFLAYYEVINEKSYNCYSSIGANFRYVLILKIKAGQLLETKKVELVHTLIYVTNGYRSMIYQ